MVGSRAGEPRDFRKRSKGFEYKDEKIETKCHLKNIGFQLSGKSWILSLKTF